MPELPEVETVRLGLQPVWEGRKFVRVTCYRPDLRKPFPEGFAQTVTGRTVERLERRAKYLLVRLSGDLVLIVHLGMSGHMTISPTDDGAVGPHDHVVFVTDRNIRVTFTDPRRFGLMDLCEGDGLEHHPLLAALGPEPLFDSFNAPSFQRVLSGRATPIKAALLDQKTVSGLGNIYVCESLFRAGIHPRRPAGSLTKAEVAALTDAIKAVLAEAIEAGGRHSGTINDPMANWATSSTGSPSMIARVNPVPAAAVKSPCNGSFSPGVQLSFALTVKSDKFAYDRSIYRPDAAGSVFGLGRRICNGIRGFALAECPDRDPRLRPIVRYPGGPHRRSRGQGPGRQAIGPQILRLRLAAIGMGPRRPRCFPSGQEVLKIDASETGKGTVVVKFKVSPK